MEKLAVVSGENEDKDQRVKSPRVSGAALQRAASVLIADSLGCELPHQHAPSLHQTLKFRP